MNKIYNKRETNLTIDYTVFNDVMIIIYYNEFEKKL